MSELVSDQFPWDVPREQFAIVLRHVRQDLQYLLEGVEKIAAYNGVVFEDQRADLDADRKAREAEADRRARDQVMPPRPPSLEELRALRGEPTPDEEVARLKARAREMRRTK